MAVKELPISTDPYERATEPHPDRLGDAASSTPLMFGGSSGLLRVLVLLGLAALFTYGKAKAPRQADPVYGGLNFPSEIQIHGSRQFILGGGGTSFGALGVYLKMMPHQVTSPPVEEWAALDHFAARQDAPGEDSNPFFDALADTGIEKSLLVQFDGTAASAFLLGGLDPRLSQAVGLAGSAAVMAALQGALRDPEKKLPIVVPPAGAQLYVTCDRKKGVHIAYGGPADSGKPRNTAPVSSSLTSAEVPGACQAIFGAMFGGRAAQKDGIAEGAKQGVVAGFTTQYWRGQHAEEKSEL